MVGHAIFINSISMADWIRRSWASLQQGVSTVRHPYSICYGNKPLMVIGSECDEALDPRI